MYYKIVNSLDAECLKMSKEGRTIERKVLEYIESNISILCACYGEERNADRNMGGYIILTDNEEDEMLADRIMEHYNIDTEQYEFKDTICRNEKSEWTGTMYIVSADFSLLFVSGR